MSNTQAGKYDKYLEQLVSDAQRLDADFQNFTTLWSLHATHIDAINAAPGFFTSVINSLRTSTIVLAHRLFDKHSISLHELIRVAKNHGNSINWERGKLSNAELTAQENAINVLQGPLYNLMKQRHKGYAHIDKKYVLDQKKLGNDFPLIQQDIADMIDVAHNIPQEHYLHRYDEDFNMQISGAVDIEHLLELIGIGRKYRKQELIRTYST